MFDSIRYFFSHLFDPDYPEGTYYFYLVVVKDSGSDYRHIKNSFKIGFSRNVEKHLVAHLEPQWDILWNKSLKIPMESRKAARDIKASVFRKIKFERSCFFSSFKGHTDWYELTILPEAKGVLDNSGILNELKISKKQFESHFEAHAKYKALD